MSATVQLDAESRFARLFRALTGHSHFPWQQSLFEEFLSGAFLDRKSCDLPTGLGKTSIIAIWLLALAEGAGEGNVDGFPRRLVYVVNRRTVVDQATREAEGLRAALNQPGLANTREALRSLLARSRDADERELAPIAISTLRGEFADNAEWRDDPARPAIIVGTVDMIGSRLLFSGYGRGFRSRPLHAGFLGQDTLLVHDEAHLEPAFDKLLESIAKEQRRCGDPRPLHVIALSATSRVGVNGSALLSERDQAAPEVAKRLNARKLAHFHSVERQKPAETIAQCALAYRDSGQAILIYVRRLEDLNKIRQRLEKAGIRPQTLTGTIRGHERDRLATHDSIFARFARESAAAPQEGTVYLICTSAGEVGIDMSADHLICDLTPFDSMAQRFGRVNRFGNGDAKVDIVHEPPGAEGDESASKKKDGGGRYEDACRRTLVLLKRLPANSDGSHAASPAALRGLIGSLSDDERDAAFTPKPAILTVSDILFDGWALTTLRDLPGRPEVADWLHGVAEWEPPETRVAWREEVEIIRDELLEEIDLDDLLDDYPLKPHELLRDTTARVFNELKSLAARSESDAQTMVWVCRRNGVARATLQELINEGEAAITNRTILLPPSLGGLTFDKHNRATGFFDGEAAYQSEQRDQYDIGDLWFESGQPRRCRLWDGDEAPHGMRLVRKIDTRQDRDEFEDEGAGGDRRYWYWYVRPRSADDEGSRVSLQQQRLDPHLRSAADFARDIVTRLGLPEREANAVVLAAGWHDLGKKRRVWQRAIDNVRYPDEVLAKSGGKRIRVRDLNRYRHELGSLVDVRKELEFQKVEEPTRELVLHLIAAHHGRARPCFPADEIIDPEQPSAALDAALLVPQRFGSLQLKYGRWGLAYLESLLRAADIMASQARPAAERPTDR